MPANEGDWRLANQESYLRGKTLTWRRYKAPRPDWDHDHCEFCWDKFADAEVGSEVLSAGYVTTDEQQQWICGNCFEDFHDRFRWAVVDARPTNE